MLVIGELGFLVIVLCVIFCFSLCSFLIERGIKFKNKKETALFMKKKVQKVMVKIHK